MSSVVIGRDGQLRLPEDVRQALGIRDGVSVEFRIREGVVELRMVTETERQRSHSVLSLVGMVTPKRKGMTIQDFETAIAAGAAESATPRQR